MTRQNFLARIRQMNAGEKEEFIKQVGQTAYDNELNYMGCSQTTLAALQQHFNIQDTAAFRAATGMAGGVGRTGEGTCGSLSAGVMAISLIYGRERLFDCASTSAEYQETINRAGLLCDKFEKRFGGLKCRDAQLKVTGRVWNLRKQKEREELHETALAACAEVCRAGAELAAEVILEPMESVNTSQVR